MAPAQIRPYRRILTSALHRRFVHASALSLLVCYIVAIAIGDKSSFFWSWFPIGTCGLRAILLFISSLAVFVLRVGQMHLGSRTTNSSLATFKYLFPLHIAQTFGWYLFSAWWFTEIYIWSSSAGAHLEMVIRGRPHERPVLNERPIYIHTYHLLLACVQAAVHLYCDYDHISIPTMLQAPDAADKRIHPVPPTSKHIQGALPPMVLAGLTRSVLVAGCAPVVYQLFLRRSAWSWSLYFAKLFWNFPRSASEPDSWVPRGIVFLIVRTLFSGFCLMMCWQTANIFFSIFLGKEPLKRGQPLTAEAKDPNGSLLTGLKAKKPAVKTFAFWELGLISQSLPERRKAIFNDIDREGGAAWSQVYASATEVIKAVSVRIEASKAPSPPAAKPLETPEATSEESQPAIKHLPRLGDPIKRDNVFANSPTAKTRQDKFGEAFSSAAKSYGQSADWTPKARAATRAAIDAASSATLGFERRQKLLESSQGLKLLTGGAPATFKPEDLNPAISQFLRSPIGQPFRQSFAQRATSIVLGSPESSLSSILDAVDSLARFFEASLTEDQFGKVQADVAPAIRLFTETITDLELFIHGGLDAHWTDVYFPPSSDPAAQAVARKVPEVEEVLHALQNGLKALLSSFKPYLRDIGIEGKDLRLAKAAAGIEGDS